MIILDNITKSLELVLAAPVSTNELPFVASYVDLDTTGFGTYVPGENDGTSSSATPVTVAAPPGGATKQRQIKLMIVNNADTAPATLTVRYNNNATIRPIITVVMAIGDQLIYTDGEGFRVLDQSGNSKMRVDQGGQTWSITMPTADGKTIIYVPVAQGGAGTTVIAAADASNKHKVMGGTLNLDADGTMKFTDDDGDLTGPMPFKQTGGFVWQTSLFPYLMTNAINKALNLVSIGGAANGVIALLTEP